MLRIPIVSGVSSNYCCDNLKAQKKAKLRKISKSVRKLADTLDDIAKKDFELTKEIFTEKAEKDLSLVQDRQAREESFDIFD
jgi:hypothetical protein